MTGRTELIYLSEELFQVVEIVRKRLGMSRSGFYRYCVMTYLESKNLLSTQLKPETSNTKKTGGSSKWKFAAWNAEESGTTKATQPIALDVQTPTVEAVRTNSTEENSENGKLTRRANHGEKAQNPNLAKKILRAYTKTQEQKKTILRGSPENAERSITKRSFKSSWHIKCNREKTCRKCSPQKKTNMDS